jgi:hypothetical protein
MGMFSGLSGGGSNTYLRLKDGDNVKVRIFGEPVVFQNDYNGQLSTKFAYVVWNYEQETAQVFQFGKKIAGYLDDLADNEDWGDVTTYDIRLGRTGSGLNDTEYSVQPSPKSQPLTEEQKAELADLNLSILIPGSISVADAKNGDTPKAPVAKDEALKDIDDTNDVDLSEIPF